MESNMIKARGWWLPAVALSLCVAARAEEPADSPRRVAPPTRIPDVARENLQPQGTPVNTASMPRAVRRAVVADAARRFQVDENTVVLASAEQVTWADGSLGCPQPGYSYTQALVPGFRVTASTAAGRMRYHTDANGNVVTCGLELRPSQKSVSESTRGHAVEPSTQPPVTSAPDR
jgi:hypothetical protein